MYADKDRLQQVLVNLLVNSIKFSNPGSKVVIKVQASGDYLEFSVRDWGIGLSEEDIPKLFIPFPDINPEIQGRGTGLGLSISKGIVELHGGRIWAESDGKDMGSTFRYTILSKR